MWAAGQKPCPNEWGICVFEFILAQKQLVQNTSAKHPPTSISR